jgi:hypothetical protein
MTTSHSAQNETRFLFRDKFGVVKDEDFQFYTPPKASDVEHFDNELGGMADGPDPENLKFDFDRDMKSMWNKKVSRYLIEELKENCKKENLPDRPDAYLEHLVVEKFTRCRYNWNQAKRRFIGGKVETCEQVEDRMNETKIRYMTASRRRERRVKVSPIFFANSSRLIQGKKWDRRMQTLTIIIGEKKETREKDIATWEWLKDVVERLGEAGMSSEESEMETNAEGMEVVVFRVRVLVWRRWIEEELAAIDRSRAYAKTGWGRGTRPGERRRSEWNPSSDRDAVPGLPRVFYNPDWLGERTSEYTENVLRVSKEDFRWLRLRNASQV